MQYWWTDLTQAAGGVPLQGWGPLSAYVQNGAIQRVLYVSAGFGGGFGVDIHEIRNEGFGWNKPDANLSTNLTNYPSDFPNYPGDFQASASAAGYETPDGIPRVVFQGLDGWVHEFKLQSDGWTVANLSAIAGTSAQPSVGVILPYVSADNYARLVYLANDAHVHELRLNLADESAGWFDADLNALAIANGWNAPNVANANAPFGYVSGDSVARVVYNDIDSGSVQELRLESSGWICANIGALAGAPPSWTSTPWSGWGARRGAPSGMTREVRGEAFL